MRTRPLPAMKLAVIGGGSTYTPELVAGLARERERLDLRELVLHDIDPERREVVGGLAGRMLDAAGYDGRLSVTDDLERALDGASFVLVQLRVGGQAARLTDETIPLACGCIGQETTGAGGLGKALRTVPVVLEIAERVRELADDDAWIVDFTNPVGIVVRSLLDAGHRAVGLCNVAIGLQRYVARMLDVEPERVLVDQVGLNHLTWVRAVQVVDLRNDGTLAGLADDDAVEVPARIGGVGPAPLPQPPLAPELLGLVQHVAAYERLAAEAAVSGDRELVYKALLAHPLVGQAPQAERLTEELLEAGRAHLPQFDSREAVR